MRKEQPILAHRERLVKRRLRYFANRKKISILKGGPWSSQLSERQMIKSQPRLLYLLPILLTGSLVAAQSQPTPVPYASATQINALLANLEQTTQTTLNDLGKVRVDKWKADSGVKRQTQGDLDSLTRNLQSALPTIINEVRSAPEDLTATFKLYHNLDALHDVFRSVAESAGAFGPRSEYQSLGNDADAIDGIRRELADRVQNLATSKEAELTRLRAVVKAAQAAPPTPPKKIVIDDTEPVKKPAKKKVPKPPSASQPTQPAQTPQQ